ncbi:MAG: hypothetical protein HC830_07380 [Bacteroidetes bacterium]|nr:hypothetical protein [Bacteroidota bacterium]
MKKLLSILFAILMLISGMHLSVATHFCMGELASVKLSFSGTEASCGMEQQSCPKHSSLTSNCCQNEIAFYSIDDNYEPSSYQIKNVAKNHLKIMSIPVIITPDIFISYDTSKSNISPPPLAMVSDVNLTDICIFRI